MSKENKKRGFSLFKKKKDKKNKGGDQAMLQKMNQTHVGLNDQEEGVVVNDNLGGNGDVDQEMTMTNSQSGMPPPTSQSGGPPPTSQSEVPVLESDVVDETETQGETTVVLVEPVDAGSINESTPESNVAPESYVDLESNVTTEPELVLNETDPVESITPSENVPESNVTEPESTITESESVSGTITPEPLSSTKQTYDNPWEVIFDKYDVEKKEKPLKKPNIQLLRQFSDSHLEYKPSPLSSPRNFKRIPKTSVIIIDFGSSFIKAGVAGEDSPRIVIPTVVGKPFAMGGAILSQEQKDSIYCGFEALKSEEYLKLYRPMDPSNETPDWSAFSHLLRETFYSLEVNPSEQHIMITETSDMTRTGRKKTMEILFEQFDVLSVYVANSAAISLFAAGLLTGVVVDIGNRMQIVPVLEGYPVYTSAFKLKRGISDINENFSRLLRLKGYPYNTTYNDMDKIRKIKENLCYVAENPEEERKKPTEEITKSYTLSDGQTITLDTERFDSTEVLFDLKKLGLDADYGIHIHLYNTIKSCPIDTRKELFRHILLTGGTTSFPGFAKRLKEELWKLVSTDRNPTRLRNSEIRVMSSSSCKYLPWYGSSMFGSCEAFHDQTILREYYDEYDIEELVPSHYE